MSADDHAHWHKSRVVVDAAVVATVLGLVALVYWPVRNAGFVWSDDLFLRHDAWLTHSDDWIRIALHGFPDWLSYFRPLGIAVFAAQARIFDVAAGPMHLVSLALHLANTFLVGLLARQMLEQPHTTSGKLSACLAMLFFGLHPALVEPVTWISSQYELIAVFFMLLGLLAHLKLQSFAARVLAVPTCFFLAACAKEAAAPFPLLLLIIDWLRPQRGSALNGRMFTTLRRQIPVYAAVLIAGVAYLAIRYWGIGFLARSAEAPLPLGPRLQMVCYTYLTYWRLLALPMFGLGPIHIVPSSQFVEISTAGVACDIAALMILGVGLRLLWQRKPLGGVVAGASAALLPVLHLVPIEFDESLYHDRYVLCAVAIACVFLPATLVGLIANGSRVIRWCVASLGVFWLASAAVNIGVTLPLWSDDIRLWQWALQKNPESIQAKDYLLTAYLRRDQLAAAEQVARELMVEGKACPNCMLDVAVLALRQQDAKRAATALENADHAMNGAVPPPRLVREYIVLSGNLRELRGDLAEAENAYRAGIANDPLDPSPHMSLALLLAREKRFDEAREAAQAALSLYAPDAAAAHKELFEKIMAAATGHVAR